MYKLYDKYEQIDEEVLVLKDFEAWLKNQDEHAPVEEATDTRSTACPLAVYLRKGLGHEFAAVMLTLGVYFDGDDKYAFKLPKWAKRFAERTDVGVYERAQFLTAGEAIQMLEKVTHA